jgi:ribonuclease HI
MQDLILLTDGSVNTRTRVGFGAYLLVSEPGASHLDLATQVQVRRFEQTSSTQLELQTLLWALGEIQVAGRQLRIVTDSQNIMGLAGRRERLERQNYHSSQNRRLNHAELYQEFYRLTDQYNYDLVKVCGHQGAVQKNDLDRFFTLVDRAARRALRQDSC